MTQPHKYKLHFVSVIGKGIKLFPKGNCQYANFTLFDYKGGESSFSLRELKIC